MPTLARGYIEMSTKMTDERLEELAGPTDLIEWSPTKLLLEAHEMAGRILALRKANTEIYAALTLCNQSRNRLTQFQSSEQFWTNEARAVIEKEEMRAAHYGHKVQ